MLICKLYLAPPLPAQRTRFLTLTGSQLGAGHGWAQSCAASRGLADLFCPWDSWQERASKHGGLHHGAGQSPRPYCQIPHHCILCVLGCCFVCLFWGEHSPEEDTPQGLCVPFPCPTLSCQKDCSPPGSHSPDSSFWCGWCFSEVPIPTAPTSPTYPTVAALTAAVHPARCRGHGSSAGQSARPWHCSLSSGETLRSWGQEAVRQ